MKLHATFDGKHLTEFNVPGRPSVGRVFEAKLLTLYARRQRESGVSLRLRIVEEVGDADGKPLFLVERDDAEPGGGPS